MIRTLFSEKPHIMGHNGQWLCYGKGCTGTWSNDVWCAFVTWELEVSNMNFDNMLMKVGRKHTLTDKIVGWIKS